MTAQLDVATLTLTLWRDHDPAVLDQPGMAMGELPATGDPIELAADLYRQGVRRVGLDRPVDLTGGMDQRTIVWTMILLRELAGWSVVADWRLRLGSNVDVWRRLNYLCPPAELIDEPTAADILTEWRESFYLCKCTYRMGPGFVEVRDRRNGSLSRFVVDDPDYLAAIERLLGGAPVAELPPEIIGVFVEEGLAGQAGDLAWWLPYRVRRWPWPSMIV